jgi:glutaminyl-tRNA synthetase
VVSDVNPTSTPPSEPTDARAAHGPDFIRAIVAEDLREGRYQTIVTRFPPEPNGYLHVGHAKAIMLSSGIARETGGRFNLRFDDTNPETEDVSFVESIIDTVKWLGADFGDRVFHAADYFEEMYRFAEFLVSRGLAYVDSATEEEIREARGTVTEPGFPTPFRERSVEENLDLLRRMRGGEFPDGAHVLRAKIDLASPNMLLRDPLLYRIRHARHHRTGDAWCIYPLYDYAHPIEDAIEGITHSLCTLEFDNNRAIYDWTVDHWQDFVRSEGGTPSRPHQYEFARLALPYTMMSKRKLLQLVNEGRVNGWDDPRLPTLAGMRRRGVTPEALREFCEMIGVAKTNSRVDVEKLDYSIRTDLNTRAPRVLCVLKPLRVTITNYPEGETELLNAPYWPHDVPREGTRPLPFSRELFIDRDDFAENPPKGFHRMAPGAEVRLRHAYIVRCDEVVRDDSGEVVELRCTYDAATRSGSGSDTRSVKGTIHWVSAAESLPCEVRLYDRLFSVPDPEAGDADFRDHLNPESLVTVHGARIEPGVRDDPAGSHYQFERLGFFVSDMVDSRSDSLVFNRTVTLRDSFAKAPSAAMPAKAARADAATERNAAARTAAAPPPRSPELEARRSRFAADLNLSADDAELLTRDAATADFFEAALAAGASPQGTANWTIHELPREAGDAEFGELRFGPRQLGELVSLVENGTLSSTAARQVFAEMAREGGEPAEWVEKLGLRQVNDASALTPIVDAVVASYPDKVAEFRGGKTGLLGFFTGQVMKKTGGKANPERVKELLEERLAG